MKRMIAVGLVILGAVASTGAVLSGCAVTTHQVRPSDLGTPKSSSDLLAVLETPGPVAVETVVSADWSVTRAGLINLDHPKAQAAHLIDGDEPIQVFFHVLHHPTRGMFLIDTGVENSLRDAPDRAAVRGIITSVMHLEKMKFRAPLGEWLAAHPEPLRGVFFTHLHIDHIAGAADVPAGTPLYNGPAEAKAHALLNAFVQGSVDRAFEGKGALNEWQYSSDPAGRFNGVIDVFGDGTVWALFVPGHTRGATAYLVRTPHGPVLFTGDACHTRWGWVNDVEPGSFSDNRPQSAASLAQLRQLVAEHPSIDVRLGHQWLSPPSAP